MKPRKTLVTPEPAPTPPRAAAQNGALRRSFRNSVPRLAAVAIGFVFRTLGSMKLYTRTGDDGTTGLIGGRRVAKDDLRLDAYGTVDELNAALGLAASADPAWAARLAPVQADLFVVGSHLAAPDGETQNVHLPALPEDATARLEREIDAAEGALPPLTSFILPGGTETAARLHLARCACRRAERLTVALSHHGPVPPAVIVYLNRLSDWLFAHARLANHEAGVADVPWKPAT